MGAQDIAQGGRRPGPDGRPLHVGGKEDQRQVDLRPRPRLVAASPTSGAGKEVVTSLSGYTKVVPSERDRAPEAFYSSQSGQPRNGMGSAGGGGGSAGGRRRRCRPRRLPARARGGTQADRHPSGRRPGSSRTERSRGPRERAREASAASPHRPARRARSRGRPGRPS